MKNDVPVGAAAAVDIAVPVGAAVAVDIVAVVTAAVLVAIVAVTVIAVTGAIVAATEAEIAGTRESEWNNRDRVNPGMTWRAPPSGEHSVSIETT